MLSANIINSIKKGKIEGKIFHIFYPDLHTSILFDKDLTEPIIHGNKNIVMTHLKKINEIMPGNITKETKIKIYSYILDQQLGYRRIQTYEGPIENIGKYIIRY